MEGEEVVVISPTRFERENQVPLRDLVHKHMWKLENPTPQWLWFECQICKRWRMLMRSELRTLVVEGRRQFQVEQFFMSDH